MKSGRGLSLWKLILFALASASIFTPLASALYPEPCQDTEQDCNFDQVCYENQCLCDISQGFQYDEALSNCATLAGGVCLFSEEISDSDYRSSDSAEKSGSRSRSRSRSRSTSDEDSSGNTDCVANAFCDPDSGTCLCDSGYEATKFGECKKGFGGSCGDGEFCNDAAFLNCDKAERRCRCAYPGSMTYDPQRRICVSLPFEECEFVEWMGIKKECVPNAVCELYDHENSAYSGICICRPGFTNVTNGTAASVACAKAYGAPCNGLDLEDGYGGSLCSTGYCDAASQKCGCTPPSTHNNRTQTCDTLPTSKSMSSILLANSRATSESTSEVGPEPKRIVCAQDRNCPTNAICNVDGVCSCPAPFSETSDGICEVVDPHRNQKQDHKNGPEPDSSSDSDSSYRAHANNAVLLTLVSILSCAFL